MCKIKSGRAISNTEDVRNLITGVILRQEKEYQNSDIAKTVMHYLKGSKVEVDKKTISRMIDDGLEVFSDYGEGRCWNGFYRTVDIDNTKWL